MEGSGRNIGGVAKGRVLRSKKPGLKVRVSGEVMSEEEAEGRGLTRNGKTRLNQILKSPTSNFEGAQNFCFGNNEIDSRGRKGHQ